VSSNPSFSGSNDGAETDDAAFVVWTAPTVHAMEPPYLFSRHIFPSSRHNSRDIKQSERSDHIIFSLLSMLHHDHHGSQDRPSTLTSRCHSQRMPTAAVA
jgi:hypothetical protein